MNSATIHRDFQKMDFHYYVNKVKILYIWKYIMKYVRGEHPRVNIDRNVHLEDGLSTMIDVRMVIP